MKKKIIKSLFFALILVLTFTFVNITNTTFDSGEKLEINKHLDLDQGNIIDNYLLDCRGAECQVPENGTGGGS